MRVLLVSPDTDFEAALRTLAPEAGVTDLLRIPALSDLGAAATSSQHVLVVGPGIDEAQAIAFAQDSALCPSCPAMVLVSRDSSAVLLRAAMRAGYRDVVSDEEDLPAAVVSAIRVAHGFIERASAGQGEAASAEPEHKRARVVTVFSTKGGVGKSVLASNLSVALARLKRRVVLLDLDLTFGDMGIMFGLEPRHTIYDVAQAFDRLDADMLQGYLMPHSSGVQVLLAPVRPEDAEAVTAARVSRVISLLADVADYIVVDTPAALDDIVLTAIERSDTVYAVATMDVASVKNTRISLQKLAQLGYRNGLFKLVLNRADSKVWLEASEIERAIERPIVARIPSDRLVPRSVNKGTPVVLDAPKSGVARSIVELAEQVVGTDEQGDSDVTHG